MSSSDKNLSDVQYDPLERPDQVSVGIVCSKWNKEITQALIDGAKQLLGHAGISEEHIHTVFVPGSYELPMGAKMLMGKTQLDAVICLGCVIKGETDHDKYINQAVANGLMQLSLFSGVPCIFGLLTVNSKQQAIDRAGGAHGNKGEEAAATAIQMINLKTKKVDKKQIGF